MIIVTGGAGFIGSAFIWKLNSEGIDDIIIVDDLGTSEKWKNLVHKRFEEYFDKNDFLKRIEERKSLPKITAIVHMGACSSTVERNADYLMRNNTQYTASLARFALENDIRFLYASTGATYGDGELGYSDNDEITQKLRPRNMYGFSKQLFDLWAIRTGAIKKIVGVKFFNVFGPNEYHKGLMSSVVFKAFNQIRDRGYVQLFRSYKQEYKDGEQKRDFVYVKDCVNILWWYLQNPGVSGLFNLGAGTARTWNDLATSVFKAMGKSPQIEYIEMPEAIRDRYQYYTQADMSKLRNAGYTINFHSLEDAITDYVQNYLLKDNPHL